MSKTKTTNWIGTGLIAALTVGQAMAADTDNTYQLKTKSRLVHFDREFEDPEKDRTQSAFAITADWTTPAYGDWIGFGVSPYFVEDLHSGGLVREDVLTVKDGKNQGFAILGQAFVSLTPLDTLAIRIGRQIHKSMLLNSSGSRAVPNTFQGLNTQFRITDHLSLYGAVYDKWSPRSNDSFEGFATDQSLEGDIDYVSVVGFGYSLDSFRAEVEYLDAKDYLSKFGLRVSNRIDFDSSSLKLTAGLFTSSDSGSLFVTGAEGGDLDDEDAPGSAAGVTKSENNGLGAYIEAQWAVNNLELTAAVSKFDDPWIEDNFSGDHGSNPFPTRSRVGPDVTNSNETAAKLALKYDWKDHVPGLQTTVAAGHGWGAENSVSESLGTADEDWREVVVGYKFQAIKGLKFKAIWHDYRSDEVGSVDGVKPDQTDIRVYLDYSYAFDL
ncbi:OprD family outer membrane porin [Marinobacter arenosus]|uniref:OprD family outer membrane porin n=1 Tax=Marinobacter arenosus TaxID=2856822 RepID=UPI001C4CF5AC|nr:OprD family outer membrane porin [Marinobacter arenosus]MBW0146210.1 OprD family porin [Marinobacter arenosus]